jgi:hypothetical protein
MKLEQIGILVLVLILSLFLRSPLTMQSILEVLLIWVSILMEPKLLGISPNLTLLLILREITVSNSWFMTEIKLVLEEMLDRLVSDSRLLAHLVILGLIVLSVMFTLLLGMPGLGIASLLAMLTLPTISSKSQPRN